MGQLFAPRAFGSKMRDSGLRCVITGHTDNRTDNRTTNRTTTFFFLADRNLRELRVLLEEPAERLDIEKHSHSVRVLVL